MLVTLNIFQGKVYVRCNQKVLLLVLKGDLSQIFNRFLNRQNLYLCQRKKKSPFLLTIIAILEHRNCKQASLVADGYDENGLQLEKLAKLFKLFRASSKKSVCIAVIGFLSTY